MPADKKEPSVIRITRNQNGCWEVSEDNVQGIIGAFDNRENACDCANNLALSKDAFTIVLLNETSLAKH